MKEKTDWSRPISFAPIGVIHTPYREWAPHQPVEQEKGIGEFRVVLKEELAPGLRDLEHSKYVILLYCLNQVEKEADMIVSPPWAKGKQVGLFASRSPVRPNPIGLSIVRLHRIEGNVLYIWPIDVFDQTPLLDIKPYFRTLDNKIDANDGWMDGLEGKEHLLEHVRGIPHDHSHEHSHEHSNEQGHDHHGHHHEKRDREEK